MTYARVLNPNNLFGGITGAVKKSLLRPKAEGVSIEFNVLPLVFGQLWKKANKVFLSTK